MPDPKDEDYPTDPLVVNVLKAFNAMSPHRRRKVPEELVRPFADALLTLVIETVIAVLKKWGWVFKEEHEGQEYNVTVENE